MLWWGCRDRDLVLDLFEMSSGQRMHTRYFQVGGVIEDIPPGFEAKVREFLELMPDAHRPVPGAARPQRDLAAAHEGHRHRARQERLLELGVTGPLLRAAGDPWDLRKAMPYSCYDHFDFKIPVGTRRRQLRPLPRAHRGDARVAADRRAGARRAARGAVHHHQPQGRAAAAARAGDLDGGADPPLQARHRGLPRAAGRGLRRGRVAARRARLLRARRRLGQARARAHARPQLREPAGARRTWRRDSPDRGLHRRASRCSTRSSAGDATG